MISHIFLQGGYLGADEYYKINNRELKGCFDVKLVHSMFLINLDDPHSNEISFNSTTYQNIPHSHELVRFSKSVLDQGKELQPGKCFINRVGLKSHLSKSNRVKVIGDRSQVKSSQTGWFVLVARVKSLNVCRNNKSSQSQRQSDL